VDHREAGKFWEENAETWTKLARLGYDRCRDLVNTPAFLEILPDVNGLRGIDIGCGEGNNTRLVARRGARMSAIDISETFIRHAIAAETAEPLGIEYQVASALELPFSDASFDFAMATMSLMDMPDHETAFKQIQRVLKSRAFFQFSIVHPFFQMRHMKWVKDENNNRVAIECGDYFSGFKGEIEEWTFAAVPEELRKGVRNFRIPRFTRTLSAWMNLIADSGFTIERVAEPYPSDEALKTDADLYDMRIIPYFLIIRCRKA
jgi:ubiquinone/menaquinone biosynthesis C-methylase UbiE